MKRVLLGSALVALFASCSESPEEKVNALIGEQIKKVLYHPETYDPTETQIDSAFAPFDDPVFFEYAVQICKLEKSIDGYNAMINLSALSMPIWSGDQTVYGRSEYQNEKDKYDKNVQNKKRAEIEIKKLSEELKKIIGRGRQFIGFKALHRYRANNNAGQTVFGEEIYLFDKELSKIVTTYNIEDEYRDMLQTVYKQIFEEYVSTGDEKSDKQ